MAGGLLQESGLIPALQNLCSTISDAQQVKVEFLAYGMENRLDTDMEVTIYRIIQELLGNILKHAQATEATIQINKYTDNLNITVEDNGIGFKPSYEKGLGLKSIEDRVKKLKGQWQIDSGQQAGTTVVIDVPVPMDLPRQVIHQ